MRSRLLAVPLVLAVAAACGGDGGPSANCVPSVTNPCTNPIDTTGQTTVTTGFVVKSIAVDGVTYAYQVFVPAGYNSSTTKVPVILFMHGSGEKGSDNVSQTNVGLGPVVKAQAASFPAIVVFPQGPAGEGAARAAFLKIGSATLDKTMSEYTKVDATRIYLTGLSYGGIAAFGVALASPTKFAALLPISATIAAVDAGTATFSQAVSSAATALKPLPIWQFQGQLDTQVNPNDAQQIKSAFSANGDPYQLTVYPNGGHTIWDDVYARADVWTWLYQQKR